jgi:hypothetical protein
VRLALWLEEEMTRRFGSRERAKREIFARSASFNYLGNGRYGLATSSEYSYTPEDAGKAALLAGITKAPRDYLPVPGDPRPRRRRNEILAPTTTTGSKARFRCARRWPSPAMPWPSGGPDRLRRQPCPGRGGNRGRAALPIFREIMLRAYERRLEGPVPAFPREIEDRIDRYLVRQAALRSARDTARPGSFDDGLPAGPRPGTPALDTKVQ